MTFQNVASAFLNFFGLSCLTFQKCTLRVSNVIAVENILIILSIALFKAYLILYVDLSVFLPEGQNLDNYTPFSIAIFRVIGELQTEVAASMIVVQVMRRKEILSFVHLIKLNVDSSLTFNRKRGRILIAIFIYVTLFRVLQTSIMLKLNFWVLMTYLARFYCEYAIEIFQLLFAAFIEFSTFLLEDFNANIETRLNAGEINERSFESLSEFYENISMTIKKFNKIFHLQNCILFTYIIVKLVLLVSEK